MSAAEHWFVVLQNGLDSHLALEKLTTSKSAPTAGQGLSLP